MSLKGFDLMCPDFPNILKLVTQHQCFGFCGECYDPFIRTNLHSINGTISKKTINLDLDC